MTDKKTEALARLAAGESVADVAKAVGVSKVSVHKWKGSSVFSEAPKGPVEVEALRLERDYWKGLAELYRQELGARS
jgi:transposase-like protein